MSQQKIVEITSVADRIALHVSNKAMQKIGWADSPDLLLEEFIIEGFVRHSDSLEVEKRYTGIYPLYGSRTPYLTSVVVMKAEKWYGGFVSLRHPTTGVCFQYGFGVDWIDGSPKVTLSERPCVVF